ncbi:hypothetical protein WBP07_12845 [Novosphingobium sp. BL-8A]
MSEERTNPVDQMKDWARRAPPANGPVPEGDLSKHLKADRMVVLLLDSNGHAYHVGGHVNLVGTQLTRLEQPRSAINELMDAYGVQDGPNWSEVQD